MVIISNGFSKFHLSIAAVEAARGDLLSCFLTGAYPTPLIRRILALPYFRTNRKLQRLAARREQLPDRLVHPLFTAEALYGIGIRRRSDAIIVDSLRLYGRLAARHVERAAAAGARIYHYRSGFGGESAEVAKRKGMFLLCDHSIAHPATLEALVINSGIIPAQRRIDEPSRLWSYILGDVERADAVLVNSRFVEDTFKSAGHDRSPVHVIYLGVDDSFLAQVPQRRDERIGTHMLFAGSFGKRKGAEMIMDALGRLGNISWQLEIAGDLDPEIVARSRAFFSDPRVRCLGVLSRPELAEAMSRADIFVFPSLAEGSARVVFEALACGCYVITTPNSGSIVEEGVHGSLVPPGDGRSLADAIEFAYRHRDTVSDIGSSNAKLVKESFTQRTYGVHLFALYKEVLGELLVAENIWRS